MSKLALISRAPRLSAQGRKSPMLSRARMGGCIGKSMRDGEGRDELLELGCLMRRRVYCSSKTWQGPSNLHAKRLRIPSPFSGCLQIYGRAGASNYCGLGMAWMANPTNVAMFEAHVDTVCAVTARGEG